MSCAIKLIAAPSAPNAFKIVVFKCIQLSPDDWELAALDKKSFTQYFGRETDVDTVLAELGDPDAELPGAD